MAAKEINRHVFLVACTVALIPTYLWRFSLFGFRANIFELAVLLVFAYSLVYQETRGQMQQVWRTMPKYLLYWLLLFLVAAAIATFISAEQTVSLGILKSWIIIPVLLSWLVLSASKTSGGQRAVTDALIISGFYTAILSLINYMPGERLAGFYDVPNSLAMWLAPIIILAARSSARPGFYRLVATAVMFIALLLTQSVVGIFTVTGILVAVAIFSRWQTTRRLWPALAVVVLIFGLCFSFLWNGGRLQYFWLGATSGQTHTSLSVRWQLWSISWDLIKQQPIFGVGLGQFEPAYQNALHARFAKLEMQKLSNEDATIQLPLREFVFRDPHNWLLSFWLNLGLFGLISFIGLNVNAIRHSLFVTRNKSDSELRSFGLALLTILLFGLFDTIFWKNDLAAIHFVLLALITVKLRQE